MRLPARSLATVDQNGGSNQLVVNTVGGADDVWSSSQVGNLTYCVSDDFGSLKSTIVSAMQGGAARWEGASSAIDFVCDSSQDANRPPVVVLEAGAGFGPGVLVAEAQRVAELVAELVAEDVARRPPGGGDAVVHEVVDSESALLGKHARAMYSSVSIGSTGNSTVSLDVVQAALHGS